MSKSDDEAHAQRWRSQRMIEERQWRRRERDATLDNLRDVARRTPSGEERALDTEAVLAHMQDVIERVARREDIPDELWAAAGLSRTVRESQCCGNDRMILFSLYIFTT